MWTATLPTYGEREAFRVLVLLLLNSPGMALGFQQLLMSLPV